MECFDSSTVLRPRAPVLMYGRCLSSRKTKRLAKLHFECSRFICTTVSIICLRKGLGNPYRIFISSKSSLAASTRSRLSSGFTESNVSTKAHFIVPLVQCLQTFFVYAKQKIFAVHLESLLLDHHPVICQDSDVLKKLGLNEVVLTLTDSWKSDASD